MSEMYVLWLGALALVIITLAFLLPYLLHEPSAQLRTSDDALRFLYQHQLRELEREHRAGNLDKADFSQAEDELHRRLLLELDRRSVRKSWQHKSWLPRVSGLALAIVVPVAALVLYLQVGDPQAAARLAMPNDMNHGAGNVQVESMVQGLADRLQQEPNNLPGWVMLARSYETMERYADAATAYQSAIDVAGDTGYEAEDLAHLWASKADALGSVQAGQLNGAVSDAIEQALTLHPLQAKALALAGAAALQQGEYEKARMHWRVLLGLLEPGSEMALKVQDDLLGLEMLLKK